MDPYEAGVLGEDKAPARRIRERNLPHGVMTGWVVILLPVSLLWVYMTTCLCGHFNWMTAVVVVPAFFVLVRLAIAGRRNHWLERCLNLAVLLILSGLVAKTASDILWNGHTPLLRKEREWESHDFP